MPPIALRVGQGVSTGPPWGRSRAPPRTPRRPGPPGGDWRRPNPNGRDLGVAIGTKHRAAPKRTGAERHVGGNDRRPDDDSDGCEEEPGEGHTSGDRHHLQTACREGDVPWCVRRAGRRTGRYRRTVAFRLSTCSHGWAVAWDEKCGLAAPGDNYCASTSSGARSERENAPFLQEGWLVNVDP
jgi:hypothetical protein